MIPSSTLGHCRVDPAHLAAAQLSRESNRLEAEAAAVTPRPMIPSSTLGHCRVDPARLAAAQLSRESNQLEAEAAAMDGVSG